MMDIILYGVVAGIAAGIGFSVSRVQRAGVVQALESWLNTTHEELTKQSTAITKAGSQAGVQIPLALPDMPTSAPEGLRASASALAKTLSEHYTASHTQKQYAQTLEKEYHTLEREWQVLEQDYDNLVQNFEHAQKEYDRSKQHAESEQQTYRQRVEQEQRKLHEDLQRLRHAQSSAEERVQSAEQATTHAEQTLLRLQQEIATLHNEKSHSDTLHAEVQAELARITKQTADQASASDMERKRHAGEEARLRRDLGHVEGKVRQLQGDVMMAKQAGNSSKEQAALAEKRMHTMEDDLRFLRAEVLRFQELHHEVLVDNDDLSTQIMEQAEKTIADLRQKERDANDFGRVLNSAIEQLTHKNRELQETIEKMRLERAMQPQTESTTHDQDENIDTIRAERDQLRIAKEQVDKLFKQLLDKLAQYESNGVSATVVETLPPTQQHRSVVESLANIAEMIEREKPVALVVDDSSTNQKILENILSRVGFTSLFARTGEQGLAMSQEHIPDLIIQDLVLPDTDGFALCEQYKANPATAPIPVIFMSALSDTDAKVRGFELGAVDYITKPFEEAEVAERVKLHYRMRKMENELRVIMRDLEVANSQAEDLYKAKSAFLANMSHELRTPLNAILGFIQILQKDPNITEQQQRYVDTIYSSGSFLLQLINDLLDLSKLEAGKMNLESEVLDLRSFVGSIKEMFAIRCGEKELSLDYSIDKSVPNTILTDMKHLRQVFVNIVGNAIKFTSKGGITIQATVIQSDTKPLLELSVRDTGRGIPADQISSIMEPFSQVRGITSEGTGLGLSLVHRIVELLNGSLRVESQLDSGSTFYITLPLHVPAHDALPVQLEERKRYIGIAGDRRPKVLIVDDSRTNRMLLRDMLSPIGFHYLEAVDGQDALNKYQDYKPDIVLMDIAMPVMAGDVAMKTIRERETGWEHPTIIIAITASIIRKDIDRMINEGFDAVLMKPFLIDELFASIAEFAGIEFVTETIRPTLNMHKQENAEEISNEALVMYLRTLPAALQDVLESDIMGQDFTAIIRNVEQITHLMESTDDATQKRRLHTLHDALHREASNENNLFFTKLTDTLLVG